jgi:hypothetical protein
MRAIIFAIIHALKGAFSFGLAVLRAPFRFLNPMPDGVPEVPMPVPFEDESPRKDMTEIYDEIARLILEWAADSIIADRPLPVPPKIHREVRDWMAGLTRDECCELMESDGMAVSSHIMGLFAIPGVRKVQPLRAAVWPAKPTRIDYAGFAAIAALEELEPDRA